MGYVARSATLILTASLQVIEAVSGLNQLDQKITQATIDSITAIHRNSTTLYEQTLKVRLFFFFFFFPTLSLAVTSVPTSSIVWLSLQILSDQITKTTVKDSLQKVDRLVGILEKNSATLVEELSKIHILDEVSVPESGSEHSDTEPVDALTKVVVVKMSEFLKALSEGRKSELILMVDHISESATKLGNKIVFDLKNLGISGIKKLVNLPLSLFVVALAHLPLRLDWTS